MTTKPTRITGITGLVESAIRMLDENEWNPSHGGEWKSPFVDITVTFQKPSRWCTKASYQVIGKDVGLWRGYMNGAGYKNIGKPNQIYSPEQLARELELSRRPLESIVAAGLNGRSSTDKTC